jgi:hypothetical protein
MSSYTSPAAKMSQARKESRKLANAAYKLWDPKEVHIRVVNDNSYIISRVADWIDEGDCVGMTAAQIAEQMQRNLGSADWWMKK